MSKATEAPETRKYELLPGRKHTVRDGRKATVYRNGEVVELTEHQARSWRDKFRPVGEGFRGIQHPPGPQLAEAAPPAPAPEAPPAEEAEPVDEPGLETEEPEADDEPEPEVEVDVSAAASDVIEALGTADAATVTAMVAAEEAKARPRKTVLAAAADRLEELG